MSSGCAPLDGPATRVGVEDEETLEDMDRRYMDSGGWGIVCAMRETEGDRFQAQKGRGSLRKKEKGMMKLGTRIVWPRDVLRPG